MRNSLRPDRPLRRRHGDAIFRTLVGGSGGLLLVIMAAIAVFLIIQAMPALKANTTSFFFTLQWAPDSPQPSFGIAALEAISMGVPVIVSEGTGLAEVVGAGYPLTVEAPERIESLSEQMSKVLRDAELHDRLANQALARAQDLYRDATEQWRLAISEVDSVGNIQTGPAVAPFEPARGNWK